MSHDLICYTCRKNKDWWQHDIHREGKGIHEFLPEYQYQHVQDTIAEFIKQWDGMEVCLNEAVRLAHDNHGWRHDLEYGELKHAIKSIRKYK